MNFSIIVVQYLISGLQKRTEEDAIKGVEYFILYFPKKYKFKNKVI